MAQWTDDEVELLKAKYPTGRRKSLEEEFGRNWDTIRRKANRVGVNRHSDYQLIRSLRKAPEPHFPDEEFNNYIVGLVDGEGTFTTKNGEDRSRQHRFGIQLVAGDKEILEEVRDYLGVGHISDYNSPNSNEQPTVSYDVQNFGELVNVIIPFFRENKPRAKRKYHQFEHWRVEVMQRKKSIEKFE